VTITPVFLDTSYFIALLDPTDQHHGAAQAWANWLELQRPPLVTTLAVLAEAGDAFGKRGRWERFEPILRKLLLDPVATCEPIDRALFEKAKNLHDRRLDKRWGLTDCTSFIVMAARGLRDALTSDADFLQAGFRALLLEPVARHPR
jgi:uncharacterized protein